MSATCKLWQFIVSFLIYKLWQITASFFPYVFCKVPHADSSMANPEQLSPIYNASADVVYYLANTAQSPADTASLALTCKSLWETLDGRRALQKLRDPTDDRLDFFQRLEVYFPRRLLCHQCATFHRRPYKNLFFFGEKKCDTANGAISHPSVRLFLPFRRVQEVMNYHRYGEGYGYPTGVLAYNCPSISGHCSFDAKIVSGELIVKLDVSYIFCRDELPSTSSSHPQKRAAAIGMHIYSLLHGTPRIPHLEDLMQTDKLYLSFKCNACWSEIRCIIDSESEGRYGETRKTMWSNLGPCRSPFDARWRAAVKGCTSLNSRRQAPLSYAGYFDDTSPARHWRARPWFC